MFEAQGIKVALLESTIDTQFASMLEQIRGDVKFVRIDADIAAALKGDGSTFESESLKDLFIKVSGNENLKVSFEALKDSSVPAILIIPEEARRIEEMMKLYAFIEKNDAPSMTPYATLMLNTASSIIRKLSDMADSGAEDSTLLANYIYKLATLSQKHLTATEMESFLKDSYTILEKL